MTLSAAAPDHLCKQCKAPMNEMCQCVECKDLTGIQRKHKIFCHACEQMYRVISGNQFLSRAQDEWRNEQTTKRKNMGL